MRDLIRIGPKTTITIILLLIGLFGIAIFFSNQSAKKYKTADFKTEIKASKIDGKEGYGSLGGTIFYADKEGIASSAELINNEFIDEKYWKSHGPLVDFDKNHHHYSIDDLKFPYVLSKKANCDTIIVMKDNVKFSFKMINVK